MKSWNVWYKRLWRFLFWKKEDRETLDRYMVELPAERLEILE